MSLFSFLFLFQQLVLAGINGDFEDYYCQQAKKPFFYVSNSSDNAHVSLVRTGSHSFVFSTSPKKKRVFIAGESTGYFLYSPMSSKSEPFNYQGDYEIINFSMIGYESERIKSSVLESLKFKPSAVVIFSGNNEWLFDPCRGFSHLMKNRYLNFIGNIYGFFGKKRKKLFDLSVSKQIENIKAIVEAAKKSGVKVFLVILPSNLFFPPFGERPYSDIYLKGYAAFESGNYEKAYSIFSKLANRAEPFASYYAGISLYMTGDRQNAFKYLEKAAAFDNRMDRATPMRNSILRDWAERNEVGIVDIEKKFMEMSSGKIISQEFFNDGAHWDGIYNCHVQREILKTLDTFYGFESRNIVCEGRKNKREKLNSAKFLAHQEKIIDERVIYDIDRYIKKNGAGKVYERIKKYGIEEMLDESSAAELKKTGKKDLFVAHIAEAYRRIGLPEKSIELLLSYKNYAPDPNKMAILALSSKDAGKKEFFEDFIVEYSNRLVYDEKLSKIVDFCGFNGIKFLSKEPVHAEKAKKMSDMAVEKIKEGKIDKAALLIDEALMAHPYDFESLMNAAYIFDIKKMPEKSIFYLNGIIEKQYRPKEQICHALNMRAGMFKKIKNVAKAREDLAASSDICER